MKSFIVCVFLFGSIFSWAQVGINTATPDPSAILDIVDDDKGILIPKISLSDIAQTSLDGMNPAAEGLLIYNTNPTVTGGAGVGFYFYNATSWEKLASSIAGADTDWVDNGADIERQAGDVYIGDTNTTNNDLYLSRRLIDWDNTNFYVDPGATNRMNEIRLSPGNAGNTKLRFAQQDSGIFSPGTDMMAISVDGTERLRMDDSGFLGLGTDDTDRYLFPLGRGIAGQVLQLDGAGLLVWATPAATGSSDADWFTTGDVAPSAITDDLYTNGNVSIGNAAMDRPLHITGSSTTNAVFITHEGDADSNLSTIETAIDHSGTGSQTGMRNAMTNTTGSGQQYGVFNTLSGNTTGRKFGVYNTITGNGSNVQIGVRNDMTASNNERQFGVSTLISGDGSGTKNGIVNEIYHNGEGSHTGSRNIIQGDGSGSHTGVSTSLGGDGTGQHRGVINSLTGTSDGQQYGVLNSVSNDGNGQHIGSLSSLTGDGDGTHYGSRTVLTGDGDGDKYGYNTIISGIGTGSKYGFYVDISNTSGGDHYGVYARALRSSGTTYAGYFLGDVAFGNTTGGVYTFPASRGTDGQVMQTDAAGQLSWVDPMALRAPVASLEDTNKLKATLEKMAVENAEIKAEMSSLREELEHLKELLLSKQ